jgi:succinoglycan biosynthesis transport protein ExoP
VNQGATLPTVRARVIEAAAVPVMPAWPNQKLILMLSLFLGTGAACALIAVKELLDSRVRTEEAVEQVTGSLCLGLVPRLRVDRPRLPRRRRWGRSAGINKTGEEDSRGIPPERTAPLIRLLDDKSSLLAHALRAVRLNIHIYNGDRNTSGQCVVFSSTFSGEGKSTLAALQALFIARTGARVLLIDADVTNPTLTRMFTPDAQRGLVELVNARSGTAADGSRRNSSALRKVEQSVWRDSGTGLDFMPCRRLSNPEVSSNDAFASPEIGQLLTGLKAEYDFVLLDLPPILVLPDARAVAGYIDHIIYVVECGQTDRKAIADALRRSPEIAERLSGCLLNKADRRQLQKYSSYSKYRSISTR